MSTPDHFVQSLGGPDKMVPLPPTNPNVSAIFSSPKLDFSPNESTPETISSVPEAVVAVTDFVPDERFSTPPVSETVLPHEDHLFSGVQPGSDEELVGERMPRDEHVTPELIRMAPPWLLSLFVHMIALIVSGLFFLPEFLTPQVHLEVLHEETGDSFDEEIFEITSKEIEEFIEPVEPVITPDDILAVENPLAAPRDLDVDLHPSQTSSDLNAPRVGLALKGREEGMKEVLLKAYKGTAATESAVGRALNWFKQNQHARGHWSLSGPYRNGAMSDNQVAATAMALLAFQGAGHTHLSGKYTELVRRGWYALLGKQKQNGDFWQGGIEHHRLYSQAQATIAICELYGMTRDEEYRDPAQRAINYAIKIQDSRGGWRYRPGDDSDTSVTGWFVMALQSARMAYLDVDSQVLENVSRYLDSVSSRNGARYGYRPGNAADVPMTAEALLCRQYLGWKRDDERLLTGVRLIDDNPIDMAEPNVYYWYYATQVLHHLDNDTWERWNDVMREALPTHQVLDGPEKGSWSPSGDRWGSHGGRLYTTALSTYMLEVYYRHLPIYTDAFKLQ